MSNLTELQNTQQILEERDFEIKETQQLSGLGSWTYNPLNEKFYWSKEMYRIHGLDPEQTTVNLSLHEKFMFPDGYQKFIKTLRSSKTQAKPYLFETTIMRPDNSERIVIATGLAITDNDGKVVKIRGTLHDITERRKGELLIEQKNEELKKLNAEKDMFLSIIAHDMKSPLNAVISISDLLKNNVECLLEFSNMLVQSTNNASSLLKNLTEWSRSQTGRMIYNPVNFDMASLINEISILYNSIAEQKTISIIKKLPPDFTAFADKDMISTVLRNLVSNAIKFTMPGGKIIISAEKNQNEISIKVSDTGVGIPTNMIGKLFKISSKYSTAGTQNETGTGLGLILCKEFVEKHNGKIWVESEIGVGSKFYCIIPQS